MPMCGGCGDYYPKNEFDDLLCPDCGAYNHLMQATDNPKSDETVDRYLKDPKPDPKAEAEKAKQERFKDAGEAVGRSIGRTVRTGV